MRRDDGKLAVRPHEILQNGANVGEGKMEQAGAAQPGVVCRKRIGHKIKLAKIPVGSKPPGVPQGRRRYVAPDIAPAGRKADAAHEIEVPARRVEKNAGRLRCEKSLQLVAKDLGGLERRPAAATGLLGSGDAAPKPLDIEPVEPAPVIGLRDRIQIFAPPTRGSKLLPTQFEAAMKFHDAHMSSKSAPHDSRAARGNPREPRFEAQRVGSDRWGFPTDAREKQMGKAAACDFAHRVSGTR